MRQKISTLTASAPFPPSAEGRRITINGSETDRLYVVLIQGSTARVRRPGLLDWTLGCIFGWWR